MSIIIYNYIHAGIYSLQCIEIQDCKMLQGKSNLVIKIKTASGGERHQINQLVRIYFQQINRSDLFCKLAVNTKCKEIFTP